MGIGSPELVIATPVTKPQANMPGNTLAMSFIPTRNAG
jgi:hypothetical protein